MRLKTTKYRSLAGLGSAKASCLFFLCGPILCYRGIPSLSTHSCSMTVIVRSLSLFWFALQLGIAMALMRA